MLCIVEIGKILTTSGTKPLKGYSKTPVLQNYENFSTRRDGLRHNVSGREAEKSKTRPRYHKRVVYDRSGIPNLNITVLHYCLSSMPYPAAARRRNK